MVLDGGFGMPVSPRPFGWWLPRSDLVWLLSPPPEEGPAARERRGVLGLGAQGVGEKLLGAGFCGEKPGARGWGRR